MALDVFKKVSGLLFSHSLTSPCVHNDTSIPINEDNIDSALPVNKLLSDVVLPIQPTYYVKDIFVPLHRDENVKWAMAFQHSTVEYRRKIICLYQEICDGE
jgi:hypothetical protein